VKSWSVEQQEGKAERRKGVANVAGQQQREENGGGEEA
jgi:hypothetical protein